MIKKTVVLICDLVENRDGVTITTDNLEFTSKRYYNSINDSLHEIFENVIHYENPNDFIDNIENHKDDIVISAIWSGTNSRNRKSLIPAICESYGIKYVGADAFAQSLCQDKSLSKLYCKQFNIEIPDGFLISNENDIERIKFLKFPVIIKPNAEGASIGISDDSIADNFEDAILKTKNLLKHFSPILVEEYIDGTEVAICCVGTSDNIKLCEVVALEINVETFLKHQIWGYESKKCGASQINRHIITDSVNKEIIEEAKKIFSSLGKVDYMRIDGRILNNKFYLIELTPDCSLHPDCFMFKSFQHHNLSYTEMMKEIISTQFNIQEDQNPKN